MGNNISLTRLPEDVQPGSTFENYLAVDVHWLLYDLSYALSKSSPLLRQAPKALETYGVPRQAQCGL